jgi:hypothetical protein
MHCTCRVGNTSPPSYANIQGIHQHAHVNTYINPTGFCYIYTYVYIFDIFVYVRIYIRVHTSDLSYAQPYLRTSSPNPSECLQVCAHAREAHRGAAAHNGRAASKTGRAHPGRSRAAGPEAAHTAYNVVTDAVFHAPMFALNAHADKNACEPSNTRSTPTEDAHTLRRRIHGVGVKPKPVRRKRHGQPEPCARTHTRTHTCTFLTHTQTNTHTHTYVCRLSAGSF